MATSTVKTWRVNVRVDDRVRVLGAVLAATDWPERERRLGLARAHIVAEHARNWLAAFREHPAVQTMQALLASGAPLSGIYSYVLGLNAEFNRPDRVATGLLREPVHGLEGDGLATQLADIRQVACLDRFFESTAGYWDHAAADARRVLETARVSEFLALCFDERRMPVFVPNLLYPARLALGIAARGEAVCICPPPPAVGESSPWTFGDDPEWTRMAAFRECCRATLRGLPWVRMVDADTIDLLATASTVIFLRENDDAAGARAFMLMEMKRGHTALPNAVEALSAYVAARQRHDLHVMDGLHAALERSVAAKGQPQ